MFYRLTQGNWQDRLAQWTKQDTKDVGDALDKVGVIPRFNCGFLT